jgi:adenosylmethionine-8-amino-7-oxononanoate aminotransferase
MNHVFHRHTKVDYPTAVSGEGCYITDSNGNRYLDASGGAAVSCLGHSNEKVRQAIHNQVDKLAFAHTGFFTNDPMEKLADFIISKAPKGIDRVYFVSGGSEAMEASIKISRQYFLEQGKNSKHKIIARKQSYHGNTIGALSAGGNQWRRKPFEPLLIDMEHISPCYEYRYKQKNETSEEYGLRVANELEDKIRELGAENVAAFIAEPVVGATMGAVGAVKGYFKRIKEICEQNDVLLILDEVMCGMGRTGTLFACEQDGITADIISVAKGLGAGYQPIGAMLVSEDIFKAINQGTGFFQHGHTYLGHATACAASLAVQEYIEESNLLENVNKQGDALQERLRAELSSNEFIGDIRGRGLFLGVEIVENQETKAPFDNTLKIHAQIKAEALRNGLMCYPMGGTIDGQRGDHVLFAPPFIINESHIDEIVEKFVKSLDAVLKNNNAIAA